MNQSSVTKFLCIKPQGKEEQISISFLLAVMVTFIVCLKLFDISFTFFLVWPACVVASFVIFAKNRVDSYRVQIYKVRNSTLIANLPDHSFHGDALFVGSEYEEVLYKEREISEEEEMGII